MAEGLVEGRSGSGTYVRERPVPRRVARSDTGRAWGPPRSARSRRTRRRGAPESRSEQAEADGGIAERLAIRAGDRVMRTRVRVPDAGEAVMLATSWSRWPSRAAPR